MSISSPFGYRIHPVYGRSAFHSGVDFRASRDTVYAILEGTVTDAGYSKISGVFIKLDHGDFQSSYSHLSRIFVISGDTLTAGDPMAITGATGRVTGGHLHFSMRFRNRLVDPMALLQAFPKFNNQ
ncbi:M23 family metallopeptidase [Mucilaginibacter sp. FT3.2]|uniref:M23 family metallopeptidase n=1 Tax=Mucilaginibacter sp. FT3.2 TaxID=2723090 RepID=UPI003B0064E6